MDAIIEAIVQLLQTAVKEAQSPLRVVRAIYDGDPVTLPESNMPAMIVHPDTSDWNRGSSGSRYDNKSHRLTITLVYNQKMVLGSIAADSANVFRTKAVREAISMMEKAGTDHATAHNSVAGIIQSNPSLPYTAEDGTVKNACELAWFTGVRYEFTRNRGFPAFEVTGSVDATVIGDR